MHRILTIYMLLGSLLTLGVGAGLEGVDRLDLFPVTHAITTAQARKGEDDGDGDDGDVDDGDPAEGADQGADGEVDFSHPKILAALKREREDAEARMKEHMDQELKGIRDNRAAIKEERDNFKERLERLETRQAAVKDGFDEDKFEKRVEERANAKYEARRSELDELVKAAQKRAEESEARVKELEASEFDSWLDAELVRASLPEGVPQLVRPGAWPDLKRRVKPLIERTKDGDQWRAQIKKDGAIIPGDNATGQMTLKELIGKARLGKGPVDDIDYYFVSAGSGSGTTSNNGSVGGSAWDPTWPVEKKTAWIKEHGAPPQARAAA